MPSYSMQPSVPIAAHGHRTGIILAARFAQFDAIVNGERAKLECRDPQDPHVAPFVKDAEYVCMHPSCAGKSWKTEDKCRGDHPTRKTMAERGEAHVIARWSSSEWTGPEARLADLPMTPQMEDAWRMGMREKGANIPAPKPHPGCPVGYIAIVDDRDPE